ncbi:glycoside hydrolase family 43 protein [Schizophyllum commune]
MFSLLLAALLPLAAFLPIAQGAVYGPMMDANFPDPSVLQVDGRWYAFSTTSGGKNVPIATSGDIHVGWALTGSDALPKLGAWADGGVWAPDVTQLADGTFLMYYSAVYKENKSVHCISAATSTNIQGPYTPIDNVLACPVSSGGAIDPHVFTDVDGSLYLLWKVDGNNIGHGGNCNNGVEPIQSTPIMIQRMSADGKSFYPGTGHTQILDRDANDGPLIEAPSLVRTSEGIYVLFFSSNCYAGSLYDVAYATATNIMGPYTKGPWLLKTATPYSQLYSPGGADVTRGADHLLFHADKGTTVDTRQLYVADISISGKTVHI